jgi:hypothetical protein
VHIIFHELTGINVVNIYSNTILKTITSGSTFSPRDGAIILGGVQLVASLLAIYVVGKWGRRPILIGGYFGIFVCHMAIGFLTIYEVNVGILVFLSMFLVMYNISTGPLAWMYAAETCCDVSLGVAIYALWFTVVILLLITEPLMDSPL